MATLCEVEHCDGMAIAAWRDDEGDVWRACEDCGDWFRSRGWDYVSQV
jgi:hypothetical protein